MNNEQQLTKKQRRELRRQEKLDQREQMARKKTTNRIILWVVIVLILGGGVYGLTLLGDGTVSDGPILVDAVSTSDHTKGATDAAVTLIEYSDFQCPACRTYYTLFDQLADIYADSVTFVYRHFPLRSIHPNAQAAAEASEAASLQGKFWEMYEQLFINQNSWSSESDPTDIFVQYAGDIGLDVEQFKTDLASSAVSDKVNADYRSGIAAQVNATPTFFLNGEKLSNPSSLGEFESLIDEAIINTGGAMSTTDETVNANESLESADQETGETTE